MTEEKVTETKEIVTEKAEETIVKTVPMRKLDVYQTDDGRRIEVFPIVGSVGIDTANDEEASVKEFSDQTIYVGVVHVPSPSGPQEIKFEIPGINSAEEAFDKYYEFASMAVEEIRKRMQQRQDEQDNQIITAPAGALQSLEGEGNIII